MSAALSKVWGDDNWFDGYDDRFHFLLFFGHRLRTQRHLLCFVLYCQVRLEFNEYRIVHIICQFCIRFLF